MRHRTSGQVFAVKRSRRRFRSKLQRERCLREIRAVAALPTHPNIVVSGMGHLTWASPLRPWPNPNICAQKRGQGQLTASFAMGWRQLSSSHIAHHPAALPTILTAQNQYRAWQEGGHFYIQMDFCEGGSLAQWAHQVRRTGEGRTGGAALSALPVYSMPREQCRRSAGVWLYRQGER